MKHASARRMAAVALASLPAFGALSCGAGRQADISIYGGTSSGIVRQFCQRIEKYEDPKVWTSATHITYGSIRMEPVFMVLGQSAATAAVMAIDGGVAVQDLDYPKPRHRLLAGKQVLEAPAELSRGDTDPAQLEGPVIDSRFPRLSPAWKGSRAGKPRLIVLTDVSNEPDDEQSLVRLLVYSNEYDLEGLIATTSVWLRNQTRPDLIRRAVDAYGRVRDNLLLHAPGFPPAAELLSKIKAGSAEFGLAGVGEGKSTEGSRLIVEVVDRPDPRPVWVAVWGGANTLAQALWDVKYTRSPEDLRRFVSKLRVYTISDQDNAGRWLRITFPELFYIVSPSSVDSREYYLATWTGISGDRHYKNAPMQDFDLVDNPWLIRNVIEGHGPLGALYPKLAYIMEGDTPSFLNLIGNGLVGHVSPEYGGWGGRYELRQSYAETRPIYTNSRDTVVLPDGASHTSNQATIWRWRRAYQHDFAARMDWCVQPREKANHNPLAVVNGVPGKDVLELDARPGETVQLSAEGSSDPDGHAIAYRWFQYPEAGALRAPIELSDPSTPRTSFVVPAADKPGALHVILELRDSGDPELYAYRRIIVRVRP